MVANSQSLVQTILAFQGLFLSNETSPKL